MGSTCTIVVFGGLSKSLTVTVTVTVSESLTHLRDAAANKLMHCAWVPIKSPLLSLCLDLQLWQ